MSVNHTAVGYIKWDDPTDDSQIFRCSLKDSADITAKGGVLSTGATVDSVRGARADLTAPDGIAEFNLTSISDSVRQAGLNQTAQITFEVEWKSITGTGSVGNGFDHDGTSFHLQTNNVNVNVAPYLWLYSGGAIDSLNLGALSTDTVLLRAATDALTRANGDYTQVTISINGNSTSLYVNGVLLGTQARSSQGTDEFDYMAIASTLSQGSEDKSGAYYKNVIFSSRPVSFANVPGFTRPVWVGDSFVTQGIQSGNSPPYGGGCGHAVEYLMHKKGFACEPDLSVAVSGSYIDDDNGGNVIVDQLAGAIASTDGVILYRGGTNDVTTGSFQANKASIEADIKGHMTTLLAGVNYVIVGTVPSLQNDPTYAADQFATNVDDMNSIINGLPAWWDAANPSDTGRIKISDQFALTGGHSFDPLLFTAGNFHISQVVISSEATTSGQWVEGMGYGKKMMEFMGTAAAAFTFFISEVGQSIVTESGVHIIAEVI